MKKILILAVFLVAGCASMFSGTKETILVNSTEKDSKIYFNEEYIGNTAASVTISKKKLNDSVIRVSKAGCDDTLRHVETKFNGLSILDFFIDFGIVTFFVVDWGLNGAIREAAQTSYIVAPNCPA